MTDYFDDNAEENDSIWMDAPTTAVVKNNWDKDHPGQVQVELLYDSSEERQLLWARVATAYCGNAFGLCVLPEIGTEVLIVFENGLLTDPIVIACLWNSGTPFPEGAYTEKNTVKSFLTKGGNKISIMEEEGKEQILLQTKAGLSVEMNDELQAITLKDKDAKNSIAMSAKDGAITLSADKKLSFQVGGKEMLTLDGSANSIQAKSGKLSANADQSLELKGASLALSAQGSLKAEASGVAEIKGSMVKIN